MIDPWKRGELEPLVLDVSKEVPDDYEPDNDYEGSGWDDDVNTGETHLEQEVSP